MSESTFAALEGVDDAEAWARALIDHLDSPPTGKLLDQHLLREWFLHAMQAAKHVAVAEVMREIAEGNVKPWGEKPAEVMTGYVDKAIDRAFECIIREANENIHAGGLRPNLLFARARARFHRENL